MSTPQKTQNGEKIRTWSPRLFNENPTYYDVHSGAFTVAAPRSTLWNSLSVNTRSADSFASFKRRLKSNPNSVHLLMPPRTVQPYCSAPIRV